MHRACFYFLEVRLSPAPEVVGVLGSAAPAVGVVPFLVLGGSVSLLVKEKRAHMRSAGRQGRVCVCVYRAGVGVNLLSHGGS